MSFTSITKAIRYLFLAFVAGLLLFLLARFLFCGPDKSVEKVAFPLAKAIVEHIEKHGVPNALNEVENLPYKLNCSEQSVREHKETDYKTKKEFIISTKATETCSFFYDEKLYNIQFNVVTGIAFNEIYCDIDITHKLTHTNYGIRYLEEENRWKHDHYPKARVIHISGEGLCKAQPFRITD